MAAVDVTQFIRQAGLISQVITAHAHNEQRATLEKLAELHAAGAVQWNVVVRDVLGKAPRIDLVAVTASGEQIVGSQNTRRRD